VDAAAAPAPPPARAAAPEITASSPLDEKARRLAEFFNGEVIELDGPIEDLDGEEGQSGRDAA